MDNELQHKDKCKNCLERAKLFFSYYKRCADEESKYTSIIFSLGYATMITIYTSLYKHLVIQKKAVFICFLFISLLLFILNEIWKMIMDIFKNQYENELWTKHFKHEISVEDIEIKSNEYYAKQFNNYLKAYPFIFIISLVFGLLAATLLFLEAVCLTF